MSYLTRDAILAADDTKFADVDVPEWGGTVRVRTISGTERDRFDDYRDSIKGSSEGVGGTAYLVSLAICDDSGKAIFKPQDMVALGAKSHAALDRVLKVVCKLNGIGVAAVEAAEKN